MQCLLIWKSWIITHQYLNIYCHGLLKSGFNSWVNNLLQMLPSKDINFVGYTYKNFEIVNENEIPGIGMYIPPSLSNFFYISFISLQICHYFLSRIKKNPFNLLFPLCTWILLPANNGMFYSLYHSNLIPKLFNWDFILYGDWTCQCHGLTWDVYCHEFFLLASNFTVSLNRCLIIWFWSRFQ